MWWLRQPVATSPCSQCCLSSVPINNSTNSRLGLTNYWLSISLQLHCELSSHALVPMLTCAHHQRHFRVIHNTHNVSAAPVRYCWGWGSLGSGYQVRNSDHNHLTYRSSLLPSAVSNLCLMDATLDQHRQCYRCWQEADPNIVSFISVVV